MTDQFTICVGTVGAGVWFSPDGGEHWRRSKMDLPFHAEPGEIQIRSLALSPHDPHHVWPAPKPGFIAARITARPCSWCHRRWTGCRSGRSRLHPQNPDVIYAGTKPPAVFRTIDGGSDGSGWRSRSPRSASPERPKSPTSSSIRATRERFGSSVEIDGVYRSRDGGESWTHCPALGDKALNQDIHGLAVSLGRRPKLLATTPDGIWSSADEGESWSLHGFPRFAERDAISYCRGVALKPDDPDVIFVGQRRFHPGQARRDPAHPRRRRDLGKVQAAGGAELRRCTGSATNPANPDIIVANSLHGYVYLSRDGGELVGPSCGASSARFARSPGCPTETVKEHEQR